MKNVPSVKPHMGSPQGMQGGDFRHRDEMTEKDWTSVWPNRLPITTEEFNQDWDSAIEELKELHSKETTFCYDASNDDQNGYDFSCGDEQEDEASDDFVNVELPYCSRCEGNHTRYRRRKDEFRVRSRIIRMGIGKVVSEKGNINSGYIYNRTKRAKTSQEEMANNVKQATILYRGKRWRATEEKVKAAYENLKQAKRNLFKHERATLRSIQRSKRFIKLGKHYSIYCANYNRYLKDKWTQDSIERKLASNEKNMVNNREETQKGNLHDTSVSAVLEYDKPKKKAPFVDSHRTSTCSKRRVIAQKQTKHFTNAEAIMSRDNLLPRILPHMPPIFGKR